MSGAEKQHGGLQMRLKKARVAANPESGLAQYLIEEAVWGHMMMPMVQKIARLAHQDVLAALALGDPCFKFDALEKLGKLGDAGNYVNHMWTELETMLTPSRFQCTSDILMPMRINGPPGSFAHFKQEINHPHEIFADIFHEYGEALTQPRAICGKIRVLMFKTYVDLKQFVDSRVSSIIHISFIYQSHPNTLHISSFTRPTRTPCIYIHVPTLEAWTKHVCPGPTRLQRFWDATAGSPQLEGHPIRRVKNWKLRAIPISFHGDGVPVTGLGKSWSRSMIMYTVSSMVGLGTTLETMLLVFACFKDAVAVGGVKDVRVRS